MEGFHIQEPYAPWEAELQMEFNGAIDPAEKTWGEWNPRAEKVGEGAV